MNKLLLALAAATLTVSAHAVSFEAAAAETIQNFAPEDSFAGVGACGVLDIKTIRAWTLEEASDLANPCLKAVGEKYQATLTLQAGFISAASAGQPAETGLILKTDLVPGSKAHRDMVASLSRRHNELLGHQVRLLVRGEVAPASVSAVQGALSGCIMTTVVRDIQTSGDFVKIYGKCLTRNPDLKISEIRPAAGLTVTLKTDNTPKVAEALNGFVTVNSGKGPVTVMIVAYAAEVAMP